MVHVKDNLMFDLVDAGQEIVGGSRTLIQLEFSQVSLPREFYFHL